MPSSFSVLLVKYFFMASEVSFADVWVFIKPLSSFLDSTSPSSPTGITSLTSISGSVIVPVLSRQSIFTLAKVSIHFISCKSTFLRASLPALTAKATLVKRYIPSGIIPTTAATVADILSLKLYPFIP